MTERVDPLYFAVVGIFRELLRFIEVVEMLDNKIAHTGYLAQERVPYIPVIADVHKQRRVPLRYLGEKLLYYRDKYLLLRARAAYRHKPASFALLCVLDAFRAVSLDVAYKLVVDIVTGVCKCLLRHGLQGALLVHSAKRTVAEICRRGLDRVYRTLGEMKRHRPVIRYHVDNVREPRVDCRLSRPDVSSHERYILRKIAENRHHELGRFLVGAVVCELAEALAVYRLPDELIEKRYLL